MNEEHLNQQDLEAIEQELVAYLDGELDPEHAARVERRLADDAPYRARLQGLQRAWDLLDSLPRAEATESFTQTTVAMVALQATGELEAQRDRIRSRRQLGWLMAVSGALAAGLVGFLIAASLAALPNRQLVRDLPVIENLDAYRNAESLAFLERLEREGLFVDEQPADRLRPVLWEPSEQRRRRIDAMSAADKDRLQQQVVRFDGLPSVGQQRLRRLHGELVAHEHRDRLQLVMRHYNDWLGTLRAGQRAELLSLEPEERVAKIRHLLREHECQRMELFIGEMLEVGDSDAIRRWVQQLVHSREAAINDLVDELPLDKQEFIAAQHRFHRTRWAYYTLFDHYTERGLPVPLELLPDDTDIQQLAGSLSSGEARRLLSAEGDTRQQMELVLSWLRAFWASHYARMRERVDVTEADLRAFYEQLSDEERAVLNRLPTERMSQELERWYVLRQWRSEERGRPRGRDGSEGRPRGPGTREAGAADREPSAEAQTGEGDAGRAVDEQAAPEQAAEQRDDERRTAAPQ